MKENFENSPENILQNIADDLSTITGTCTEIKESQLNCATADDLKEYAEKVENVLKEGVIPAVNKVNELIKNPPTYNIEMKTDGLAENIKNGLSEAVKADLYKCVDKVIKDGISSTYAQSVSYLKNAVNDLRYEVNRIISGHWWLAMPKWAKITAIVSVLAAIVFASGFFYMVSENQKYQKVEWLYRYERMSYNADGIRDMMLREEAMMVGTKQEQDSIKALTVQLERRKHAERTHVYFRPSDSWTPESKSIW